jgi:hypothetical protein
MSASKLEILIFRLAHKIATKFERLQRVFGVRLSNKTSENDLRLSWKKPEVETPLANIRRNRNSENQDGDC